MKPIRQDGELQDILFESTVEVDLLHQAVRTFASSNEELCIFVDLGRSRLASGEERTHPTTVNPEQQVFGLAVPARFAGEVISAIASVSRDRRYTEKSIIAKIMINEYWGHCPRPTG